MAFSPDGKHLATASSDKTARVWEAASGAGVETLEGHSSDVSAVAFSPDGKHLATAGGGDSTARVWEAASGACVATLEGHSGYVSVVTFSPDGKHLVTASEDKTAILDAIDRAVDQIDPMMDGNLEPVMKALHTQHKGHS